MQVLIPAFVIEIVVKKVISLFSTSKKMTFIYQHNLYLLCSPFITHLNIILIWI